MQADRDIAYTTVMSTVHNLHRKGRLTRVREGRKHRYRTTASRAEHSAELMREAVEREVRRARSVAAIDRILARAERAPVRSGAKLAAARTRGRS